MKKQSIKLFCIVIENSLTFTDNRPMIFPTKQLAKRIKEELRWNESKIKPCKIIIN